MPGVTVSHSFVCADVFGYRLPDSQGSQNVQAMDTASLPPGNPAINALYEADHPWAESRMEGALLTGSARRQGHQEGGMLMASAEAQ